MRAATLISIPVALFALNVACAQDVPQPQSSSPEAASSPHQREVTGEEPGQTMATGDAQLFVTRAAQGGMTEVELGKLALSKTSDPTVRAFANRMVADHTKANDELMSIAQRSGLQAPSSLDAKHKSAVEKLSTKSGKDFDAAYARQMVQDHHETVALFEGAAKSNNADLAAFARKTLPTLKDHTSMAQKLP